ncbi:MAG: RHS repeat-associated core domain-containing protein, partial [Gammaproteobacteria bacterium]|nr:RHS repeat-associated core domain-containing protein [Gammaproteobacteria bacterium]
MVPVPKTFNCTYDNNGNMLTKSDSSEPLEILTFNYDSRDRLVQTARGPPGNRTLLGRYDYNARGMRVRHLYSERGDIDYYYDGNSVIEERNTDGTLLAHYRYADRLFRLDTASGSRYYHHDALGSTVNLTDSTGNAEVSYKLDPWGHIRSQTGATVNRHIFTGQEHDENTGLIYFDARYYDPDIVRFITQDVYPGELRTPSSRHGYVYAYSNPTVYVDLLGYQSTAAVTGRVDDRSDIVSGFPVHEYDYGFAPLDWISAASEDLLNLPVGAINTASYAAYQTLAGLEYVEKGVDWATGTDQNFRDALAAQIQLGPSFADDVFLRAPKALTYLSRTRHLFSKVRPALRSVDAAVVKGLKKAKSGAAKITAEVGNSIVEFAEKVVDKSVKKNYIDPNEPGFRKLNKKISKAQKAQARKSQKQVLKRDLTKGPHAVDTPIQEVIDRAVHGKKKGT